MIDEETGAEPKIVSASISDPFLLLIRDDASIFVASCDEVNELEELEREDDTLLATKWISGCLYTDSKGLFASQQNDKGSKIGENILMFLLSAGGAIYVSLINIALEQPNGHRFTHCLICQNQSTSPRVSVSSLQQYPPISLQEDQGLERL
jgi:hypothetical protein